MLIVTPENMESFKVKTYLKWIALKFRLKLGKKLFIDCGTNLGQGFEYFQKYFPLQAYDAVLIEPNPNCVKVVREKYGDHEKIDILQKAVWIEEAKLKFFGLVEDQRGETSSGASVVESHNSAMYVANKEASIEVEGFSFGDFLSLKSKEYDVIIVKLDIESAEYAVLDDLIKKGTIKNISHIFVEFHSQYFDHSKQKYYRDLEDSILSEIQSSGIGVSLWV